MSIGRPIPVQGRRHDELMAEVQSEEAIPLKLAKAVVGLMLTIDKQAKGGGRDEEHGACDAGWPG